jgi:hypothetical protein
MNLLTLFGLFAVVASTPEEFAQHVKVEFMKWAKVIKASNIKAE